MSIWCSVPCVLCDLPIKAFTSLERVSEEEKCNYMGKSGMFVFGVSVASTGMFVLSRGHPLPG